MTLKPEARRVHLITPAVSPELMTTTRRPSTSPPISTDVTFRQHAAFIATTINSCRNYIVFVLQCIILHPQ